MLYEQQGLPIFQNRMYDTLEEALASPKGNVCLVEDLRTGLVRNAAFQPGLLVYDASYQNEQGLSPMFRRHLEDVAAIITTNLGQTNLVEVGCGKGLFLEMLVERGVEITGFDPAYEGTNSRIRQEYFQPGSGIASDGLILRHVLEHIPNPVAFLGQLKEASGDSGYIYIEVPCFDWICEQRAWFDVFYEHVNYFRLSDFHRMFGAIVASGRIFGGQYLYVVADLATLREPTIDQNDRVKMPEDFTEKLELISNGETQTAVIWGGASKGVIFSLMRQRQGQPVLAVIDINPSKQGKFLPLTGLKVQSPSDVLPKLPHGSDIYVMNRNYSEEIKKMSNNAYNYVEVDRG